MQYYKVKNSWGPSWGDNGYILIQKGKAQSVRTARPNTHGHDNH